MPMGGTWTCQLKRKNTGTKITVLLRDNLQSTENTRWFNVLNQIGITLTTVKICYIIET